MVEKRLVTDRLAAEWRFFPVNLLPFDRQASLNERRRPRPALTVRSIAERGEIKVRIATAIAVACDR